MFSPYVCVMSFHKVKGTCAKRCTQRRDVPRILQLVISRKTALVKVNTGVRSKDDLAYSLQLGGIPK